MSGSIPTTVKQWNVVSQDGLQSLQYSERTVPALDDNQVLVKSKLGPPPIEVLFTHSDG